MSLAEESCGLTNNLVSQHDILELAVVGAAKHHNEANGVLIHVLASILRVHHLHKWHTTFCIYSTIIIASSHVFDRCLDLPPLKQHSPKFDRERHGRESVSEWRIKKTASCAEVMGVKRYQVNGAYWVVLCDGDVAPLNIPVLAELLPAYLQTIVLKLFSCPSMNLITAACYFCTW